MFTDLLVKDKNGKPLAERQRVKVAMGNPRSFMLGTVAKVCFGQSIFETDDGTTHQRPNQDLEIIE